jgi:hypothetical protein
MTWTILPLFILKFSSVTLREAGLYAVPWLHVKTSKRGYLGWNFNAMGARRRGATKALSLN